MIQFYNFKAEDNKELELRHFYYVFINLYVINSVISLLNEAVTFKDVLYYLTNFSHLELEPSTVQTLARFR